MTSTFENVKGFWSKSVWTKLELPFVEILVHFLVTVLSIVSLEAVECLAHVFGWDRRELPGTHLLLADVLFWVEVVAAIAVIVVGIGKAIISLARS